MEASFNVEEEPIILVYYKFRGMAQMVRHLLCYLNLPFQDIYIEQYQKQKLFLSTTILNRLKEVKINVKDLPLLIHQDFIIYQVYPIMAYLCRRFDREDLLGKDMQQKAQVQQIMEIYIHLVPNAIKMLFGFAHQAASIDQDALIPKVHKWYEHFLTVSGYMRELSEMLLEQKNPAFILSNITIVDFYYIVSAHVFMGIFGCISTEIANKQWHSRISAYKGKIKGLKYLLASKGYLQTMKRQPYYLKHRDYLEAFAELGALATEAIILGLSKLWATDIQILV